MWGEQNKHKGESKMNENTALATLSEQEQAELALLLDQNPDILRTVGVENIQNEDLARPPYLKVSSLNKPVETETGEEIPAGDLVVMPDAKTYGKVVEVVILASTPTTFCYRPPYGEGDHPYCLSDAHGMSPIEQGTGPIVTNPQRGPCRKIDGHGVPYVNCPLAKWGDPDPETGKGEKPSCTKQLGFVLWLIDEEGNDGVVFRTHSTANKYCGKHLNTFAAKFGIQNRVVITTRKLKEDGKTWIVPIATKGDRLTNAELYKAIRLKKEWEAFLPESAFTHDEYDDGYVPDENADIIEQEPEDQPEIPF
jgi:hypothetical protein